MKRSEINQILRDSDEFIKGHGFHLPPFAYWTAAEWQSKGPEVSEIVENGLGWDITDFGGGKYHSVGLFLFTLRNGSPENMRSNRKQGKTYAEKIMIVNVDQITPLHFHWVKTEDIINRGGGNLVIQLYNATPDEQLDDTPVTVSVDGVLQSVAAGYCVLLHPGESITLPPYLYHKFWGQDGRVLVGEVSVVNDDRRCRLEPINRFGDRRMSHNCASVTDCGITILVYKCTWTDQRP
jgi:D-lyxose ketol-isomerase